MPLLPQERQALVEGQRLRFKGGEWKGSCVRCGGDDRFHVTQGGLVGCRQCGDRPGFYASIKKAVHEHMGDRRAPYTPPSVHAAGDRKFQQTPSPTRRVAVRLWGGSVPATGTLAHIYLADRMAWPPPECGVKLPVSVRWVPVDEMRRAGCKEVPDWVAGAALFRFTDGQGKGTAVSLEALDHNGIKRDGEERWRRTYGSRLHSRFVAQMMDEGVITDNREATDAFKARIDGPCVDVAVCEGEVTALAVALSRPGASVLASGGTSNLPRTADMAVEGAGEHCNIIIEVDGDGPGHDAANKILEEHPSVTLHHAPLGMDAADVLRDRVVNERREKGGSLASAWNHIIADNMTNAQAAVVQTVDTPRTAIGR